VNRIGKFIQKEVEDIYKISDEKMGITTNTNKIQKVIMQYFKSLYTYVLKNSNIEEMDQFPGECELLKLNQEYINPLKDQKQAMIFKQ
jgi:hypothetical protein